MSNPRNRDESPRISGTRPLVAPELLPALDKIPPSRLNDETLSTVRSFARAVALAVPLSAEQRAVLREELLVPGLLGAPDVRVLVYKPSVPKRRHAALLDIHGGGFVLGEPEMNDSTNRSLVAELGCIIVSIDYRLAPETHAPGAVEDCYAALSWLHNQADELKIDRKRIAIGGKSAGGGHAAALALLARDRGRIPICLQLLEAPMLDDRTGSTPDLHPVCGEFVWTAEHNRFGWRALLGMEPGRADVPPALVPARAVNLSGLPPAFIIVGSLDLFLEENIEYARRLVRARVSTELHVIPGAFHGFGRADPDVPQIVQSKRMVTEALKRAFKEN